LDNLINCAAHGIDVQRLRESDHQEESFVGAPHRGFVLVRSPSACIVELGLDHLDIRIGRKEPEGATYLGAPQTTLMGCCIGGICLAIREAFVQDGREWCAILHGAVIVLFTRIG
jgi:hypothetical protein